MSAPPRRQQPERDHELGEPEGPERLTEVRYCRDGDHRVDDEQAHEAEKHVRAQPDLGVRGQCHQERQRQGALRKRLADVGRDVQEATRDVGQSVEVQQRPSGADPAPGRAIPCFGRVQRRYARTAPECDDGHELTTPGVARSARPSPCRHGQDRSLRPSPVSPRIAG